MSEKDLQPHHSNNIDTDGNVETSIQTNSTGSTAVESTHQEPDKNKMSLGLPVESEKTFEELSTVESHTDDSSVGVSEGNQLIDVTGAGINSEINDCLQSRVGDEQSNGTFDQQSELVEEDRQANSVGKEVEKQTLTLVEADAYKPKTSPPKTSFDSTESEAPKTITAPEPAAVDATAPSEPADNTTSATFSETNAAGELVVTLPPISSNIAATSEAATTSATAVVSTGSQGATANEPVQSVYHVKWVTFKNNSVAIVTQNENGPCPLLAIINVLLLQGKIKLPALVQIITSQQLMEYLGDCILEQAPKVGNVSEDALLNYEQNMSDAMAVFHKLQTGLDVNVRFTGVADFEYTPECIVFDLLGIPLYHGWLVDPESPEVVAAISNCSYNQLVEKIIAQKNANKEELVTEALIAESFLESSASQLTYHGLSELGVTVKEDELCVFFRNNHFCTLYKHKNELFLMVTDQGFLTEPNVVWETLSNVEGDCYFVDANFRNFTKPEPSTNPIPLPTVTTGSDMQIDQDYLVALSLQQEQQMEDVAWQQQDNSGMPQCQLSDHELAMQLQAEEDSRNAAAVQQQQQPRRQAEQQPRQQNQDRDKKKSDCTIL